MGNDLVITGTMRVGAWDCEWRILATEEKATYSFPVLVRNGLSGGIEYKIVSIEGDEYKK